MMDATRSFETSIGLNPIHDVMFQKTRVQLSTFLKIQFVSMLVSVSLVGYNKTINSLVSFLSYTLVQEHFVRK